MRQWQRCSTQPPWRLITGVLVCLLAAHAADGCILSDTKCDAHQVQSSAELHACTCEPGYVSSPAGYGCIACGENEETKADKCVCKQGFVRANETAPCEASEGSVLGADCSADQACSGENGYCALTESEPYCTRQGCTRNDDCPADWRCGKDGDKRFCQKPPQGFGKHCTAAADCAGQEAAFCETLMTNMCIVSDCLPHPGDCPSQSSCCDLTGFVGTSLCVANSVLSDGKCPGGAAPVSP